MKITIMTIVVLLFGGIGAYVISFINGAIYVDYALGCMMGILAMIQVISIIMVERSKEFTDGFRKQITNIKLDTTKQELYKQDKLIEEAKKYVIGALEISKSEDVIKSQLLNNGLTENDILEVAKQLTEEGLLQAPKVEEEKPKVTKKKVKKKKK